MTDVELLKSLVIFLAKCYQSNYFVFGDASNVSIEVKEKVPSFIYDNLMKNVMNFSTIQGSENRKIFERIAELDNPNLKHISNKDIDKIFNVLKDDNLAKRIYNNKFSEEAKQKKIKDIKNMWHIKK